MDYRYIVSFVAEVNPPHPICVKNAREMLNSHVSAQLLTTSSPYSAEMRTAWVLLTQPDGTVCSTTRVIMVHVVPSVSPLSWLSLLIFPFEFPASDKS